MSLSIGTLVGYLQLDDTQFNRKADAADKKINGLKLHLEALSRTNPKLKLEVEANTKALEDVQARIVALKAQAASGVNVRVEMVQALVELDRLQNKLRSMHNAEIKVHVDDKEALGRLDAIQKKVSGYGSKGGMFGNIAAFGPAILPFLNVVPGGLFAIGSGAVAAASGVGVLALAFHGLGASASAYQTYMNKLPFAQNAKQVAALKKTLALSAYGDATPQARTFARTLIDQGLPAGQQIKAAAQAGVLPGMTQALHDLMPLVGPVSQLVKSLGDTMGHLADQTAKSLNSPFWRQWMKWLAVDAKTQISLIGGIFGHFFQGLMQGIQRFSPQGTSLLTWLDNLSKKFQAWTGSPQFDHFIATTAADATLVANALKAVGPVLANLYKGLSAAGGVELLLFTGAMQVLANIPTGAIQALGVALPIIFLGMKAIALGSGIVTGIKSIATAFTFLATSESMAATAGRLGLIGVGLLGVATAGKQTSQAMSALQGAASGATTGAGIGMFAGPEGAAIGAALGGLAGLTYGLATSTHHAASEAKVAIGSYTDYASTLDGVAAAATTATRAMVYQRLEKSGLLDATRQLGLTDRQAVNAMMGNQSARNALSAALRTNTTLTQAQRTALAREAGAIADSRYEQLQKNIVLAQGTQQLHDARRALREFMASPASKLVSLLGADSVLTQLSTMQSYVRSLSNAHVTIGVSVSPATSLGALLGAPSSNPPHPLPKGHRAAGGTIDGQRSPYGDKVLTMLAPGEEVISNSNGQADKWRPMLKAINAGMAGGGTVPGDPLAGFGPGSIPASGGGHTHHRGGHHGRSASAGASKANAAWRRAWQARLSALNAELSQTNSALSAAQNWSQSFAGNAFSANLAPFEGPGPVTTSIINGMKVTQSGATDTSPAGILKAMLAYQKGQQTDAGNLASWVTKLRGEGVSKAVLAQMQTAGPQGVAQIQALASGTVSQVRQFNAMNVATTASLNQTGAMATGNTPYSVLQQRQLNEQSTIKAIKHALTSPVPVRVIGGNLRP